MPERTQDLRSERVATLSVLVAALCAFQARTAVADDGGNDVCPATAVAADDVRERYDASGHLVHQLRLAEGRVVQEIAIAYDGDRARARTEVAAGRVRVARNYWHGDQVVVAECYLDGKRTGYVRYHRDRDDRVTLVDKRTFVAASGTWIRETTSNTYDADGQLLATEVRDGDGRILRATRADRAPPTVPVVLALSAGGSYQSDTRVYGFTTGLSLRRDPEVQRYASDPLEVGLEGTYRYHRAAGVTSVDQTTLRFGVDYHDVLPRFSLFTFTSMERNLATNLRLYLEEAFLGAKLDVVRTRPFAFDLSFAPIWSFRSIEAPMADAQETTSKLRGSFRARAGLRFESWSLVDTFEFLPTIFGDDFGSEGTFWERTIVRNTVTFEVSLAPHLKLRELFKYTWDPAMRAQASCPDSANPLCLGYAFTSTTTLAIDWTL